MFSSFYFSIDSNIHVCLHSPGIDHERSCQPSRLNLIHRLYIAMCSCLYRYIHSYMCTTICIHVSIDFLVSGNIKIPGGMAFTVDSDLNEGSPQFTLTCISTGGPATTVTWTRDSVPASGDEMTVFNGNTTAAQYTHTLTVTGGSGKGGDYTCTVSNNRPSSASASYTVQGAGDIALQLHVCMLSYHTPHSSCLSSH